MGTIELILTATSALGGIVAAVFAALAYFGQLSLRRKKGTLRICHIRNHPKVAITATNEGRVVRVNSVLLEPEGMKTLCLDAHRHTFKDGAPIDITVEARTLYNIPVDVESRFVLVLSDGSALCTRSICLSKVIDSANVADHIVDLTPEC